MPTMEQLTYFILMEISVYQTVKCLKTYSLCYLKHQEQGHIYHFFTKENENRQQNIQNRKCKNTNFYPAQVVGTIFGQ